MDVYSETLVRRRLSTKERRRVSLLFFLLIAGSILFILLLPLYLMSHGIAYLSTVSMLTFAVLVFFVWRMLRKMQQEFEYIITNGTLDVDRIVAQKKRTRLISLELSEVEEFGLYRKGAFEGRGFDCILHAERDPAGDGNFYLLMHHPSLRRTLLVFTPDDAMLSALRQGLPRRMQKDLPQ